MKHHTSTSINLHNDYSIVKKRHTSSTRTFHALTPHKHINHLDIHNIHIINLQDDKAIKFNVMQKRPRSSKFIM